VSEYVELGSGLIVPESWAPPARLTAIDLFCGAGGFSLGLVQSGYHVVAALDAWPTAALTYLYNLGAYPVQMHFIEESDAEAMEKEIMRSWKRRGEGQLLGAWVSGGNRPPDLPGVEHFFLGDVRKITGRDILDGVGMERGEVDLVVGGPPCQGFSQAGRRNVMDPRNSLVFEFARLVVEMRPKTMCMENVPGIMSMVTPEGLPVVDVFCRILEDGGFGAIDSLKRSLLSTAGCGAALRTGKARKKGKPTSEVEQQVLPLGRPA
jgi:DNA (cytosine-5)-methyltransferase 1